MKSKCVNLMSAATWTFVALLCLLATTTIHARDSEPAIIPPLGNYQAAIEQVAKATDRASQADAIDRYVALDHENVFELVRQVLWYSFVNKQRPGTRVVAGLVLKRLEGDKRALIGALVQLLDDDERIESYARNALRGYEDGSAVRPPDYSIYHAILEGDFRDGMMPNPSLVEFMYDGDPGVALLTIMRASQMRDPAELKPILWAEHVVADLMWRRQFGFVEAKAVDPAVVRELDKLSQHKEWWVRMYVAEIIRRHPEMGTKAARDRLAADTNDLVRTTLNSQAVAK